MIYIKECLLLCFTNFLIKYRQALCVITYANNEHPLGLAMQKLAEELHKL